MKQATFAVITLLLTTGLVMPLQASPVRIIRDNRVTTPRGVSISPNRTTITTQSGTIRSTGGYATYPDGTIVTSVGTIITPEGLIINSNGTRLTTPAGTIRSTGGFTTNPNGVITTPAGTIITPTGTIINPSGGMTIQNSTITRPTRRVTIIRD